MSPDVIQIAIGIIAFVVAFKLLKNTIKLVICSLAIAYIVVNFIGLDKVNEFIKYMGTALQSPAVANFTSSISDTIHTIISSIF